tara:strand:- start:24915 stop:26678 length:1764 start_codon:yes stop_codon:yes gene_type:complete
MVVNESFLDSATVRENVVSLARNIGYVPRSRTASKASVYIDGIDNVLTSSLILKAGLVGTGNENNSTVSFSIPEDIEVFTTNRKFGLNGNPIGGKVEFGNRNEPIEIYQGTYLTKTFIVNQSLDQRFILDNSFIDTSTIYVYVADAEQQSSGLIGTPYRKIDNILNIDKNSETYLIQEIQDERYELLFGDGIFGKKIENGAKITVQYIVTDGLQGNGPTNFVFSGTLESATGTPFVSAQNPKINTVSGAANGGDIETLDSIKYFAPRLYAAQYRAVTARDYESIIQQIYPNTESVSVVGGEEIDPPQFGTVFITIKPQNGDYVSDFDKTRILSDLKNYSLTGINQKILDLKVLYIELDSYIYYDNSKVEAIEELKTKAINGLTLYSNSIDINKFGGRFKYSKVLSVIDNINTAITSNITKVRIRRNLNALLNRYVQYELCFGNQFNVKPGGLNIKSTGFTILGESQTVYLTDTPNEDKLTGTVSIVKELNNNKIVVVEDAGTVDYIKGELNLTTINITSTVKSNNIIEVQAFPESNDIIGLKDLYLKFSISDSTINMVKDTISSGDQISGVGYKVTSSYTNGDLIRA